MTQINYLDPKSLNAKISKMRASKKEADYSFKPLASGGSYSMQSSLVIAERFKWLPEPVYAELKALPWSDAMKKRALLMLRFYFSKVYMSFRNDVKPSELGYVAIHSKHWINICSQNFCNQIQKQFFKPLHSKYGKSWKQGEYAMQWSLKNKEHVISLLQKNDSEIKGSDAFEKNLTKLNDIWDPVQRMSYMTRKGNALAELHHQNHLSWIEPIRKKLDKMPNYQPIVDFLVAQGVDEDKAKVDTNRFIQAAFWEYCALQRNNRRFIQSGFHGFSRIHTPSNILKKNIESFLIGETIYRFDIVSCHIAVLAVMSEDETLIDDLRSGTDVYLKLCPTSRKWAKKALLTLINDQETEVEYGDSFRKKVLPLQKKFEALYPVAGQYLDNIKRKNMSFSIIGCEIEQQFMRKATEVLQKENPELLAKIKFEHDGIASLSREASEAFQNAFYGVLEEEWASSYRGILKSKLSQSRVDLGGVYREEPLESIQIETDEPQEEKKELTIDNMFDDLFSDSEGLISTYKTKVASKMKELEEIEKEIESFSEKQIPKSLISRYRAEAYDLQHWKKQIEELENDKKNNKENIGDEKWNLI